MKLLITGALAAVSLIATSVIAQTKQKPEPGETAKPPGHHSHMKERMAKLDVNGDGKLSKQEASGTRLAARFAKLDVDANGYLTAEEMQHKWKKGNKKWMGKGGRGHKHGGRKGKRLLSKLDVNDDGKLSLSEVADTRLASKFSAIDTDADGLVTLEELRAKFKGVKGVKGGKRGKRGKGGKGGKRGKWAPKDQAPSASPTL